MGGNSKDNESQEEKTMRDYFAVFLLEMIGTAILITGISLHGDRGIIVPAGLYTAAMIAGKVTGAHFNLNVTVGIYIIDGKYKAELKNLIVMFLG